MIKTGVIRRIDDLGRIVIPKDARRTLGIREGDPLEIMIDKTNGMIGLTKYRAQAEYLRTIKDMTYCIKCEDKLDVKNYKEVLEKLSELEKLLSGEKDGNDD